MSSEFNDWFDFEADRDRTARSLANSLHSQLTFTSNDEVCKPDRACGVAALPEEYMDDDGSSDFGDDFFIGSVSVNPVVRVESAPIESDSGWVSDPENLPFQDPNSGNADNKGKNNQVFRSMGYTEWEDDITESFLKNWTRKPDIVRKLMREMFEEHEDVHEVVLFFIRYLGRKKNASKKYTLNRALLLEFLKWKREREGSLPSNAELTLSHQRDVLSLMSRSHTTLVDELTQIYQLLSLPDYDRAAVVEAQLKSGRLKEAVECAFAMRVQRHFNTAHMLLPLVDMDKINLVERYVAEDRELQIEFISIVDELGDAADFDSTLFRYMSGCKWMDIYSMATGGNSKLKPKHMHKIGKRFVQMYELDIELFPRMSAKNSSAFLHHVLASHYIHETITKDNIDDLIQSALCGAGVDLHKQLVSELVSMGDTPASAKWALKCQLPAHALPAPTRQYMANNKARLHGNTAPVIPRAESPRHERGYYLDSTLPMSAILFVDDQEKLQQCHAAIVEPSVIIGIDSEWKLVREKRMEKLAVLQLALKECVFLLDMVILPQVVSPKYLCHFFSCLFCSKQSLKLGYSIHSDLAMLKKTLPFLREALAVTNRVLDLQELEKQVEGLCKSTSAVLNRATSTSMEYTTSNNSIPSNTHSTNSLLSNKPHPVMVVNSTSSSAASILNSDSDNDSIPVLNGAYCGTTRSENFHSNSDNESLPVHPLLKSARLTDNKLHLPPHPIMNGVLDDVSEGEVDKGFMEEIGGGIGQCGMSYRRKPSGLSALVAKYLGKPLDKSYQLSNWERRPLWREQVEYAALDAHCLLAVYESVMAEARAVNPAFSHC